MLVANRASTEEKLLVIGVKLLEHAMRIERALNVHMKEAFIGLQCI
jgi:hypothetical protein